MPPTKPIRPCCIVDCDRGHYAKGFCQPHYRRKKNGAPLHFPVRTMSKCPPYCFIPTCDSPAVARNLCNKHYQMDYREMKKKQRATQKKMKAQISQALQIAGVG